MKKTAVVYWSGTGNTEAMALAVLDGMILGGENKNAPHLSAVKACEYLKENGVKGLISHLKYDVGETVYEKEIENYKTIAKIAKECETIEF